MIQTKVMIILKVEFNTVLESNQKLEISSKLLHLVHMKQTKVKIILKVESNIVLELNPF